jgi:hypothetical protein
MPLLPGQLPQHLFRDYQIHGYTQHEIVVKLLEVVHGQIGMLYSTAIQVITLHIIHQLVLQL